MFPQLPTGKEEIKDSVKYYQIILVILYLNIISFTYRILNFCMGTVKIHLFEVWTSVFLTKIFYSGFSAL